MILRNSAGRCHTVLAAFAVLILANQSQARELTPEKPCSPGSALQSVPASSPLGRNLIERNEKSAEDAHNRWPEVDQWRWLVLASTAEATVFLDTQTPRCTAKASCECSVWFWIFDNSAKDKYKSTKQNIAFRCSKREMQILSTVFYGRDGSGSASTEVGQFEEVVPETLGESLLIMTCDALSTDFRFYQTHLTPPGTH